MQYDSRHSYIHVYRHIGELRGYMRAHSVNNNNRCTSPAAHSPIESAPLSLHARAAVIRDIYFEYQQRAKHCATQLRTLLLFSRALHPVHARKRCRRPSRQTLTRVHCAARRPPPAAALPRGGFCTQSTGAEGACRMCHDIASSADTVVARTPKRPLPTPRLCA
eukprot:IDg20218t1